MNPYEAVTSAPQSKGDRRRLPSISTKCVAWNGLLFLIAALLFVDNYPRFLQNLSRFLSRPDNDVYAVASFARITGLFTPVFILVALSSFFFTKQNVAIRLLFLIPLFSFLMHSVPPRNIDCIFSVIYLLTVSSILLTGVGWPILLRDFVLQRRADSQSQPDGG